MYGPNQLQSQLAGDLVDITGVERQRDGKLGKLYCDSYAHNRLIIGRFYAGT